MDILKMNTPIGAESIVNNSSANYVEGNGNIFIFTDFNIDFV